MNTLKTALVSAVVALGALSGSMSSAKAGDVSFGLHFNSNGLSGGYIGIGRHGHGHGHGYGGHGGHCSSNEALWKAKSMGINKRWIQDVSHKSVVVRGKKAGHPVKLVLARKSAHCAVKSFNYI